MFQRNLIVGVVCVLQLVIYVQATGLYSVVFSEQINPNEKFTVSVSLHKAEGPAKFNIGITGALYNETKAVEVEPMSSEHVAFEIPTLGTHTYNLTAEGVSGVTAFKNTTTLTILKAEPKIYIQTDKATYKPGDLVQFRVIFLDYKIRPAKIESPISMYINDKSKNLIKQWKDVKITKGVYTGKFQLSEQPPLGTWNIEVKVGEELTEKKTFDVDKYVLPKYDVAIETAKDVSITEGVIKVTVRSKYTYGKSVNGKATVFIKPKYFSYYSNNEQELNAEKTFPIDGKGHVEFELAKDLHLKDTERFYSSSLSIVAVVEEELTGNKFNTSTTITLHKHPYRIEFVDTTDVYHPGKPLTATVVVKKLDDSPAQDRKTPLKLKVLPQQYHFYHFRTMDTETTTPPPEPEAQHFESFLDEHGMASFEVTIPESNHSYYLMTAEFGDVTSYASSLRKYQKEVVERLKLSLVTKDPEVGKDVTLEVKSNEIIPYIVYNVIARKKIIKSEHVKVPLGSTSHTITFTPTFEMIPSAKVFVYYIFEKNFRYDDLTVNFKHEFQNSMDISAEAQVKPGEEVKLKIKTDPESFVGLLGVDQSVLLLKSGNDLSKTQIFNDLESSSHSYSYRGFGFQAPGSSIGLVTFTNAEYPTFYGIYPLVLDGPVYFMNAVAQPAAGIAPLAAVAFAGPPGAGAGGGMSVSEPPQIRKEFPENWLFQDVENTDDESLTISKKVPDTITSWVITGFSMNSKTGIALTSEPTKIRVFQPFFVSTNLPYSVKRGEVIAIPVIIFNYLDKALEAEVTMDNTDKEYDFTEATNEVNENPINEVKRVKRVSIPSNSGRSISFMIRPNKVGQVTLKITAVTPLAGDTIHQVLKVEPEGVTKYENRAFFVDLSEKTEHSEQVSVDMPKDIVPDSEYIEFSVIGDLLGPAIKNLDNLVKMPYGCGEQNMINFVPNILVLQYLKVTNKEMPVLVEKAKKFLEVGYQRELTYKHDDGSYSAFGKSDGSGSTWLTAYVMRSFHQALPYTDIDTKILTQGLDFLASKQAENGSFPEYGRVLDFAHHNELGLTSFVLLALLENTEFKEKYQPNIEKGVHFLVENIDKCDNVYSLSIAALALQLAKNPLAEKLVARLETLAKTEDNLKWWSNEDKKKSDETPSYWTRRSNDIEVTSYVLLSLLETQKAESAVPIIKWLVSQRNSQGGFSSTQDTVVGLQALIKFAYLTGSGKGDMKIDIVATGGEEYKDTLNVNSENSLILQTHVLPKTVRNVNISAKGKGSSVVQVSYRYNVADKDKKPSFHVKSTVKENTPPKTLIVDVCSEFVPLDGTKESNMAVLEVALPSGYTAEADSFSKIAEVDQVKRTETKNSDSTVIVYFDSLKAGEVKCIPVEASKTHAVAKQKPASVIIYDYYDTERRATDYYDVKSSLCDICEGEDCGKGCTK